MKKGIIATALLSSVLLIGCNNSKISKYNKLFKEKIQERAKYNDEKIYIAKLETTLIKINENNAYFYFNKEIKIKEIYYTNIIYHVEQSSQVTNQNYYGFFIDSKTIYYAESIYIKHK